VPSKNVIKTYAENTHYHIFNRGVEKKRIFYDRNDYTKFLYYLKIYLSPLESLDKEKLLLRANLINNNLSGEIDLLAYCLMPNHFHFLVKQNTKDGITKLMRQLTTAYSMYFNKRYNRIGPLFQGIFKACPVESDEYLLHLSRYIHLNPAERGVSPADFEWSSYPYYLGNNPPHWLKPKSILAFFKGSKLNKNYDGSYKKFIEDNQKESEDLKIPKNLLIEE
jgi:putative transposase